MSRPLIVLLAATFVLASGAALANESDPYCETSQRDDAAFADPVSQQTAILRDVQGSGACEGEQWEGRDGTGSEYCGTGVVYLNPSERIDRVGVYKDACADPEKPQFGIEESTRLRVIGQGSPGWKDGDYNVHTGSLQATAEVWGVATVAVFLEGEQYLVPCIARGEAPCSPTVGQGLGDATMAAYFEDHTDQMSDLLGITAVYDDAYGITYGLLWGGDHDAGGNIVMSLVHLTHATNTGGAGEEDPDCTQNQYEEGGCTRDNTAVTVELLA